MTLKKSKNAIKPGSKDAKTTKVVGENKEYFFMYKKKKLKKSLTS